MRIGEIYGIIGKKEGKSVGRLQNRVSDTRKRLKQHVLTGSGFGLFDYYCGRIDSEMKVFEKHVSPDEIKLVFEDVLVHYQAWLKIKEFEPSERAREYEKYLSRTLGEKFAIAKTPLPSSVNDSGESLSDILARIEDPGDPDAEVRRIQCEGKAKALRPRLSGVLKLVEADENEIAQRGIEKPAVVESHPVEHPPKAKKPLSDDARSYAKKKAIVRDQSERKKGLAPSDEQNTPAQPVYLIGESEEAEALVSANKAYMKQGTGEKAYYKAGLDFHKLITSKGMTINQIPLGLRKIYQDWLEYCKIFNRDKGTSSV
jgi:hypothetical protein